MTAISPATPAVDGAKKPSKLADMVQMANGLNAARVFAAMLVVLLHSAVPYLTSPIPAWVIPTWILLDTSQHVTVDLLVFGINGFVMPLFFLLAGLSAAKACFQTPFREFAWQRGSRLGASFLLAGAIMLPVLFVTWSLGLLWTERVTMSHLVRLRFPDELQNSIGPAHLWFLQYLLLLSVGWCAVARLAQRWPGAARVVQGVWAHAALGSAWRPLVCAVPTAIIFAADLETPYRLMSHFIPDFMRVCHYSVFFIVGVWISNLPQAFSKLRAHAAWYLLAAGITFAAVFPLTIGFLEQRLTPPQLLLLAVLQAIFTWCLVWGFLGLMLTWFADRRESIRYLNEGSFWLYLAHFPIVCVVQLVVWPLPWPAWGKVFIVAITTIGITLLSYETCVRYSVLGAIFNGSRKQHPTVTGWRLEAGWLSVVAVGLLMLIGFVSVGWDNFLGGNFHTVAEGRIYRSNRLRGTDLDAAIAKFKIRAVLCLGPGQPTYPWYVAQVEACEKHGIPLTHLPFSENQIPAADELEQLQIALEQLPRPVLLIGGNRSPTLAGLGSAVAVLTDGGPLEEALQQFDLRYFQLDGAEHCLLARPLLQYRAWLAENETPHSAKSFRDWSQHVHLTRQEMSAAQQAQPDWQARTGAPRFPRQF